MINREVAEQIVALLNELVELDRPAVAALLANRIPCNGALANHPTVQCGKQHGGFNVGLLGILNGIGGVDEATGYGGIAAVFDKLPDASGDFLDLVGFRFLEPSERIQDQTAKGALP